MKGGSAGVTGPACPPAQGHHGQREAERRTVPAAAQQNLPGPGTNGRVDGASGPPSQRPAPGKTVGEAAPRTTWCCCTADSSSSATDTLAVLVIIIPANGCFHPLHCCYMLLAIIFACVCWNSFSYGFGSACSVPSDVLQRPPHCTEYCMSTQSDCFYTTRLFVSMWFSGCLNVSL